MSAGSEVRLRTNNWFDAGVSCSIPEVIGPEHIAVVGNSNRRHSCLDSCIHKWLDTCSTIEHRVLGMNVKVNERIVVLAHVHSGFVSL